MRPYTRHPRRDARPRLGDTRLGPHVEDEPGLIVGHVGDRGPCALGHRGAGNVGCVLLDGDRRTEVGSDEHVGEPRGTRDVDAVALPLAGQRRCRDPAPRARRHGERRSKGRRAGDRGQREVDGRGVIFRINSRTRKMLNVNYSIFIFIDRKRPNSCFRYETSGAYHFLYSISTVVWVKEPVPKVPYLFDQA